MLTICVMSSNSVFIWLFECYKNC